MTKQEIGRWLLDRWLRLSLIPILVISLAAKVLAQQPVERTPVSTPAAAGRENTNEAQEEEEEEEKQEAAKELKAEEHQRILGVLPNFNTSSVQNAAKLSAKQKIELATRSAVDPVVFAVAAIDGAWSQSQNSFPGYGQGMAGYGKRVGASYADSFSGTLIGNAFLPILFKSDPRYFRKGVGSFKSRLLYAISTTVRTKQDDGSWAPNYANVLGNIAAGGLSNLYYPSSDRGLDLTFERAFTVTAEGSLGALFVEFWPDIARHYKRKHAAVKNQAGGR